MIISKDNAYEVGEMKSNNKGFTLMIQHHSPSNNRSFPKPVFLVSHSVQEAVCEEIYQYLVCKKLLKLKEAALHLNRVVKQIPQVIRLLRPPL